MKSFKALALAAALGSTGVQASVLIEEAFDDGAFSSRGWYDNVRHQISKSEHIPGSAGSLQFTFRAGETSPTTGGAMRRKFPESESVYLSYYVKYSSNWVGSGKSYHPHQFYFMSNMDGAYSGLAETYLTAYVEENGGRLQFVIQDTKNIDQGRINQDLTNVTEARAVAGCNGSTDGYRGDCYRAGSLYRNGKSWKADVVSFTNTKGQNYKADWHHVEAYIKLNSIVNGKGVADGIARMWVDGKLIMDRSDILMRTGARANMRLNQFAIGPYIGDGSPVEQSFWIDNLTLATERPAVSVAPPSAPTNLRAGG